MKKMTGILLMAAGAILLAAGLFIYLNSEKRPTNSVKLEETTVTGSPAINETLHESEMDNKTKGDAFEKFIVQKFNKEYFTIKEWAGDKYVNGRFAETTLHPDLVLELELNSSKHSLAVECKWKQNFYKNGVEFATQAQVDRYKKFEAEKGIPVFVAVGIGGKPSAPENLFILPLAKIKSNFLNATELESFKKTDDGKFFYDIKTKELR